MPGLGTGRLELVPCWDRQTSGKQQTQKSVVGVGVLMIWFKSKVHGEGKMFRLWMRLWKGMGSSGFHVHEVSGSHKPVIPTVLLLAPFCGAESAPRLGG